MNAALRLTFAVALISLLGCLVALTAGVGQVELGPPLRFDPDPLVVPIGTDWSGDQYFDVAVVNDSNRSARIVGAEDSCGAACSYGIGLPAEVSAGGRGRISLRVVANNPGTFSNEVTFFTDQPSQPRMKLRVQGTIPPTTKGD